MSSESHDRFAELFVRHQKDVFRYLVTLVPNLHDADELFQQTCLTLWKSWESYDPSRDFGRWARGIAHNHVRNHVRKPERRQVLLAEDVLDLLGARRAERADLLEDRRSALAGCIQKLPRDQHDLLLDVYADGHDVRRISDRTGRSANVLYKLVRKIRAALYDCVSLALEAGR